MCRRASSIFLPVAFLAVLQLGVSLEQPKDQSTPFQWLPASGETSGVKYQTHRLRPLSLQQEGGAPVEIEQEETKVDAQTTHITSRAYMISLNGERQLMETVVEEIRKLPGDRMHAVRTTSRKDSNGRFGPIQQEIQDMAPSGTDSYQVKKTLLLPGNSGTLVEKERIQQTERKTGDKSVEIDRTRYMRGLNNRWDAAERRVSQNTLGEERTRTEEQVYQYNVNNELSLARQIQATEWKDSAGRHWQSESYAGDLEGKLQLESRTTMLQAPQRDGRQVTTETLEKPSPAAPTEGLKLVRKVVENLKVVGPSETERQLEVLEPDLNGRMRSIDSRQSIEVK